MSHDRNSELSEGVRNAMSLVYINEGPAQAIILAVAPSTEETETKELVWHPVIYVGRWVHSQYGKFEVKLSDFTYSNIQFKLHSFIAYQNLNSFIIQNISNICYF